MIEIVLTALIVLIWGLPEFKEAIPEIAPIMSFQCNIFKRKIFWLNSNSNNKISDVWELIQEIASDFRK